MPRALVMAYNNSHDIFTKLTSMVFHPFWLGLRRGVISTPNSAAWRPVDKRAETAAAVAKRHLALKQASKKVPTAKGACTNDVSREGEGGGYPNSDGRRGRLRDLYSKNSDKGGRGSKIPKI